MSFWEFFSDSRFLRWVFMPLLVIGGLIGLADPDAGMPTAGGLGLICFGVGAGLSTLDKSVTWSEPAVRDEAGVRVVAYEQVGGNAWVRVGMFVVLAAAFALLLAVSDGGFLTQLGLGVGALGCLAGAASSLGDTRGPTEIVLAADEIRFGPSRSPTVVKKEHILDVVPMQMFGFRFAGLRLNGEGVRRLPLYRRMGARLKTPLTHRTDTSIPLLQDTAKADALLEAITATAADPGRTG